MRDQVEEIKNKIDIVDVISEYVDLKKAGTNYKGVCPFHSEKTPSFMVNPELQIYKCFGCDAKGDVFTFLEEYEGMEFYESLKFLAEKTGVVLKKDDDKHSLDLRSKRKLYDINESVHRFYQYMLHKHTSGSSALEYLKKERGLTDDTITAFQIGYAPNDFSALEKVFVLKKKATKEELEKVGLSYLKNGRPLDRFRGRIMFPLFDHRGNLNGFAGRILPHLDKGDTGKYINSPETILHHKGNMLFGLWTTRKEIKKTGFAVLVEGPMDAIASYQGGVKNVVAIQGTSLTQEQVKLLARFTKKLVFCLDSDFAGEGAERRGIQMAESEGLEVRVAQLTGFKDPGEAAIQDSTSYKKAIKEAIGVWDFIINTVIGRYDNLDGETKAKISRELAPLLATIADDIVRSHYIGEVARKLSVPVDAVSREVVKKTIMVNQTSVVKDPFQKKEKTRKSILEERFLSLAFSANPEYLLSKDMGVITELQSRKLLDTFLKYAKGKDTLSIAVFSKELSNDLSIFLQELLLQNEEDVDRKGKEEYNTELNRLFGELELLTIRSQLDQLAKELKSLTGPEKQKSLLQAQKQFQKLQELQSQLEEM